MRREDYNRGGLDFDARERDYNRDDEFNRGYEGRGNYGRDFETRGYDRGFDRDNEHNRMGRERNFGRDFDEDRGYGYTRSSGYQDHFGYGGYNEGNTGQNWGGRNYSQSGYGGQNYRSFDQGMQRQGMQGQGMQGQGMQGYGQGVYGQNYGGQFGQHQPGQFGQHQQQFGHPGFYGQRNDDEIEREVYDRLDNEWQIPDNADLHVTVKEGVVTLTGQVRNRNVKMAAWNCVWQIPGVEDVHNNISIQSRRRQNQGQSGSQSMSGQQGMTQSTTTGQQSQSSMKSGQQDTSKNK